MAAKMIEMSKFKTAAAGVAAVVGLIGQSRMGDAGLILTLSEPGVAPVTVNDGAYNPVTNPGGEGTPDLVRYTSAYGDFTTNFEFGLTDQLSATSPYAYLQIQSFQVTSIADAPGVVKTLTVQLQETDPFSFPGTTSSLVGLNSSAGGTLTPESPGDSITFQSFATPLDDPTISPSAGPVAGVLQAGGGTVTVPLATTYFTRTDSFTLENDLVVSLNPNEVASINGSTNVFIPTSPVPEPVTGSVVAVGALALIARRRRV